MVPRLDGAFIPAFAVPEVNRALISLPLEERLSGGFHRRFLARVPELVPPSSSPPRQRSRWLAAIRRRLPPLRPRRPGRPDVWFFSQEWESRPAMHAWIADDVLQSTLLSAAMGDEWCRNIRDGFLANERRATRTALLAAAPVALESALMDL